MSVKVLLTKDDRVLSGIMDWDGPVDCPAIIDAEIVGLEQV